MAKHQVKYYTKRQYNTLLHILEFPDNYDGMNDWNTNNLAYTMSVGDSSKRQKVSAIDNSWFLERGFKPIAKINAGFFYGSSSGLAPIGLHMSDWGNMYGDETVYYNRWQAYYKDGVLVPDLLESQQQLEDKYRYSSYWGISLSYMLVKNGVKDLSGTEHHSGILGVNPRTLIGQKKDGTHIWVVADGRGKNDSTGLTADQSAQVMLDLGCHVAMNCDGGGSSTMVVNGKVKNSPTDGSERSVSSAFIIYGKDVEVIEEGNNSSNEGSTTTKRLVLDPGHGFHTPGKRTPDDIREWSLNSGVATKLIKNLEKYKGLEITRTDDTTGETDIALADRMNKVNAMSPAPDLFVSIHHNALGSTWGEWTGTEVYAHPLAPTIDKTLATKFAEALSRHTGLRNRGKKEEDFYVLRHCPVSTPAVLCEGGFMDSTIDHPVITSESGQQKYADALEEVIVDYLGLQIREDYVPETPSMEDTPVHDSKIYYSNGQSKVFVEIVGKEPLNVRSGRGKEFDIIGSLPVGTKIMVNYILADNRDGQGDDALWGSIDYSTSYDIQALATVTGYIHLGFAVPAEEEVHTPPTITLNGNSTVYVDQYGTYTEQGARAVDENGQTLSVNIIGTVNTRQAGSTVIRYQATDSNDLTSEVTRTVIVNKDTVPPTITLKGDSIINVPVFGTYVEPGYTTTDNSGEEVRVTVTGGPNTSRVGQQVLTYTATDVDGLTATVTRTVNVFDDVPPTISLVGDEYMIMNQYDEYIELGAIAEDNYDEYVDVTIEGTINTSITGEQQIHYTATDSSNNRAFITRTVNVLPVVIDEPDQPSEPVFSAGVYGKDVIVNSETLNVYSSCSESSRVKAQLIYSDIIYVSHIFYERFDATNTDKPLWGAIETNCKAGYINLSHCSEI